MNQIKKFLNFQFQPIVTKDASGECIIEGYANTSTKDRVGDIVMPSAFEKSLKTYLDNPILLENHNWDKVAGVTQHAEITDKGLFIRARISDTRPDLKTQVREGCLRTFSIGYNEIESDYDEPTKTKVIKELELLEVSIVSVPANPEAKFQEISGNATVEAPKEATPEASAAETRQGTPAEKPEGKAADAMQVCVADKISKLLDEGYERDQAIAIAFHVCGEKSSKSIKSIGKVLTFLGAVKEALGVETPLTDSTVLDICEYHNANEEIMTKQELIKLLREKAAPAADPAPAAKPEEGKADPAAAPAEAPKADDMKAAMEAMMQKLAQIADGVAQLLEAESAEEPKADEPAADDQEKSIEEIDAELAVLDGALAELSE